MTALLDVANLSVSFPGPRARIRVIEDVSLRIGRGEIVGLVGESGSGKSVTALATMRLLGAQAAVDAGSIALEGRNLLDLPAAAMLAVRGQRIAMIFQEPMTSLNPLFRAGFQIAEALEAHLQITRREARRRAIELMRAVGIPSPELRVDDYPHQLSGGMRQRVMIAMAMACSPQLLIADEPTTALDVTIQAQILALMRKLRDDNGMGILLITHDLGVIAGMADRVVVMYAGQILEEASAADLFAVPRHPYTRLLLRSVPRVAVRQARLHQIAGTTPSPSRFPSGCRFHPRCPDALDRCRTEAPPLDARADGRRVRCWRADETGLESARAP
ncbi:MAG: ABC transporter ATP-binding protein [Alphaproteobacteria bacterium]|nr:ABC transporter ATP-binding protein [Alphaproteobacteria bacterium]